MNIFEILRDVLVNKEGQLLQHPEDEKEFVPFLIQRWVSMHSITIAELCNNTTNMLWSAFKTKQEWYQFFLIVLPKTKFKKINYIKKVSKNKTKEDKEVLEILAEEKELSQREIQQYLNMLGIKTTKLSKLFKDK